MPVTPSARARRAATTRRTNMSGSRFAASTSSHRAQYSMRHTRSAANHLTLNHQRPRSPDRIREALLTKTIGTPPNPAASQRIFRNPWPPARSRPLSGCRPRRRSNSDSDRRPAGNQRPMAQAGSFHRGQWLAQNLWVPHTSYSLCEAFTGYAPPSRQSAWRVSCRLQPPALCNRMSRSAESNRKFSQCLVHVMDGLYPSRVTMSAMDFRLLT